MESGSIFVLGNGPSLGIVDLTVLRGLHTFACNALPHWEQLPFVPRYYGIMENVNPEIYLDGIETVVRRRWGEGGPKARFLAMWRMRNRHGWVWVRHAIEEYPMEKFGFMGLGDTLPPIKSGYSTPITQLQIAAWLGYRTMYLLGVDLTPGAVVVGPGLGPDGDSGERLYKQRFKHIADSAKVAKAALEAAGGGLWSVSPISKLNPQIGYLPMEEAVQRAREEQSARVRCGSGLGGC